MEAGKKQEVNLILRQYKLQGGAANFPELFKIPNSERMVELAKKDFEKLNLLIIGALTMAFESLNLKKGMNALQILDLSEAIIDSAGEDNLSFEDFVLFLQYFVRGKYETSYESMDIPKFMRIFDIYRNERWQEGVRIREDQENQYKAIGGGARSAQDNELATQMSRLTSKLSEMKEMLRDTKRENDIIRKADKFYGK